MPKHRSVWLLLILVLLSGHGFLFCESKQLVFQGFLDLRGHDLKTLPITEMNGDWEWYWEKYINPGDISPSDKLYSKVPGAWNSKSIHGEQAKGQGYCSYRLYILADPDQRQLMGFRFPDIINCFRVYYNGQLIIENGSPGTNKESTKPRWAPRTAYIYLDRITNELILHIASYRYRSNGFQQAALIGNSEHIAQARDSKAGRDSFMLGVFLIIGLYHLGLFMLRPQDASTLHFGLFSLIIGLRNMSTNERLLIDIWPHIPWALAVDIEFITMPITAIFFILYLQVLFKEEFKPWIVRMLLVGHMIYALIVLVTPAEFFSEILIWYHMVLIFTILVILYLMFRAAYFKREGAWLVIGGFAALVVSVVNDILFVNHVLFTGHILSYGVFIFIFSQSFILSIRFSRAFRKVEDMSDQLQEYNQNLFELVDSRTRELQQERNLLKQRNEIIESELDLARRIQHDLIPSVSYLENLDFYYRPMEKVGGDFFDFIQYPDPQRIGIFISDVSGHGVPAALVTSMIKSTLLQIAPMSQDPAYILSQLNTALHDKTAGNFVTAFYGILDLKTRELVYSNAGHNVPYVIQNRQIRQLGAQETGMPLSILTNQELDDSGKPYRNETMTLLSKSKFFLYTDGLLEAIPQDDSRNPAKVEDFDSASLLATMTRIQDLPCQFFIREMAQSLVQFRGGENFDDDVCMICVDIN